MPDIKFWQEQIRLANKKEETWRKRGREVIKAYRDEDRKDARKLNILWANTELLKPATYSQTPQADVRRRFLDDNPIEREAAETLERALSFSMDDYDFDAVCEAARDDMLLPGRGCARVRYSAEIVRRRPELVMQADELGVDRPVGYALDGMPVTPDGEDDEGPFIEEKASERAWSEHVHWEDLRLLPSKARCWTEVRAVAFRHMMTRDEMVEEFGQVGERLPLGLADERDDKDESETLERGEVWEIWDKDERERIWIALGYDEIIDTEEDPLNLAEFFPIPDPLYAIRTTDTMVPVPEYTMYQDQANELNDITERLTRLTKMLKVTGLYDSTMKSVIDLEKREDGEFSPVDAASGLRDSGGLNGAIFMLPLENIARAIVALNERREVLKAEVQEITGLSDILRGSTKPSETYGAQRLKANFGNLRMTPRSRPMQFFVRDMLRLKAELMAEKFSPRTFQKIVGKEVSEDVIKVFRDEKVRNFRIDVETDSTIQPDAAMQKQDAVEFLGAVTQFLSAGAEIAQVQPLAVPMLGELLKWGVRQYNTGRVLEQKIEETVDQLSQMAVQMAQAAMQQPQADPAQQEAELEAKKLQQEGQISKARLQQDGQLKAAEIAQNTQLKREEIRARGTEH